MVALGSPHGEADVIRAIIGWLARIGIGTIAGQIAEAWKAREQAKTDAEKVAADERIKTLEMRRDVLVAESGSRINAFLRLLFVVPVALYVGKLFVWDKVLGLGVTDPLSPMMEGIMWTVIGFLFLDNTAGKVTRIWRR